ncbi:MAG: HupE/UreJ family protein [Pseudomonadota bacterium]
MRTLPLCLMILATVLLGWRADAHALEPGYLEITPVPAGEWQVVWRKPQVAGAPMQIEAVLPESCAPRRPPAPRFDGRAYVSSWQAACDRPIWDGLLFIEGLSDTATDVLVRFQPSLEQTPVALRLTPDHAEVRLPEAATPWSVVTSYFSLGVAHILGGLDHLLFVFALMLLIRNTRRLFWAITAFTVAHSVTLAVSALGWVTMPMPPVEAVIALSIAFLANEILLAERGEEPLTARAPWTVTFSFGLLHGLGFASALREIGLPETDIPLALLSFNIGVEAGQLLFVAVVALFGMAARFTGLTDVVAHLPARAVAAYGIGTVAAFWTIERVSAFFA